MTRTYGNQNLPPGTPERPLVTFALFAYNQEKYIREAVEGAFSQTYSPLEIILSDDCSSDRTFEIMEEMAAAYRGPHMVRVRRNPMNLLTAFHVQAAANEMTGDLMVVAAGDDISLPQRVDRLIETWLKDDRKAVVLHSQAELITEDGRRLNQVTGPKTNPGSKVDIEWLIREERNPLLSPSAAYCRSLFDEFPPLIGGSLIEDGPLINRGFLMGHFLCASEPLLLQRKVPESSGTGYSCDNLGRWNRFVRSKIISRFNKLQDISAADVNLDHARILSRRARQEILGLSRCIFSDRLANSVSGRLWMAVNLFLFYPATYRLTGKIGFVLQFSRFTDLSRSLKTFRKLRWFSARR